MILEGEDFRRGGTGEERGGDGGVFGFDTVDEVEVFLPIILCRRSIQQFGPSFDSFLEHSLLT